MKNQVNEMSPYSLMAYCKKSRRLDRVNDADQYPDLAFAARPLWVATFAFIGGHCSLEGPAGLLTMQPDGWIEMVVDFAPVTNRPYSITVRVDGLTLPANG